MIAPTFSIIVPIYNSEKYLPNCLKSIEEQTYGDFECILVDDGSTDNSLEICQTLSRKDARFKVFHTDNCGVSHARNVGIDHSNGRYITFIDSDDVIETIALEVYHSVYTHDNQIDIIGGVFG